MDTEDKIQWHEGFFAGIEWELRKYKTDLVFDTEYQLSKKALEIDMLVIQKTEGIQIEVPFGKIFRKYNIIEYKSPDDGLTIDDFFKSIGYACLYKGLGETVNAIPGDELTVSMFCYHHPRKAFSYLTQTGAAVREAYSGIYYIENFMRIPIQVVVTQELEWSNNHSLRLLTRRAGEAEMREYLEESDLLTEPGDMDNASAVLRVCIAANPETFEKVRRGFSMSQDQILRRVLHDLIEEGEAKGRAEGEAKGRAESKAEVVAQMLRESVPVKMITKWTQVSAEKIVEIAQSIGVMPVID